MFGFKPTQKFKRIVMALMSGMKLWQRCSNKNGIQVLKELFVLWQYFFEVSKVSKTILKNIANGKDRHLWYVQHLDWLHEKTC